MENPYPKDVFKWDNPEELDFNRGRFNQHCFEVWENCKIEVLKIMDERIRCYRTCSCRSCKDMRESTEEIKSQIKQEAEKLNTK